MSIEEAAASLNRQLLGKIWFTAVGVQESEKKLFLYVKHLDDPEILNYRDGWAGFDVEVKTMDITISL